MNYKDSHFLQNLFNAQMDDRVFANVLTTMPLYADLCELSDEDLISIAQSTAENVYKDPVYSTLKESTNTPSHRAMAALTLLCHRYRPLLYKYIRTKMTYTEMEDMEGLLWLLFIESVKIFNPDASVPFAGFIKSRIKFGHYNTFQKLQLQWNREVPAQFYAQSDDPDAKTNYIEVIDSADTANLALTHCEVERLRNALSTLPQAHKDLLLAVHYEQRMLKDIAKERGISKQAMSKHYRRALALLRDAYDKTLI